jgi:hypothetical protein
MSVVMNLFEELCNMKNSGSNIAVLLMRRLTMTFWHAYSAVRRVSLALGWSLCNGILQHDALRRALLNSKLCLCFRKNGLFAVFHFN